MQGFEPSVHHFRKTGVISDIDDGDIVFGQQPGGAAGRDQFHVERNQGAGENKAGLVGNAEQGTADGRAGVGSYRGPLPQ